MSTPAALVLPDGVDVPFPEVAAALAHRPRRDGAPLRAWWATVVVVGPDEQLREAAAALRALEGHATVRGILLSVGHATRPVPRLAGDLVAVTGLEPAFVNNVVAALRLSSLPTLVWWRGGEPDLLRSLARLADRVVIEGEPAAVWPHAARLFDVAGFSDLRWTRLTRWRALMAGFFDVPEVREAAPSFTRIRIAAADGAAAELFAHWVAAALARQDIRFELAASARGAFIEEIRFGDGDQALTLRLAPSGACVLTSAVVRGHRGAERAASLGDRGLAALVTEELRVRSRDRAFEAAVQAWLGRV